LNDILVRNGGNNYAIGHMGKERMLRDGVLSVRVEASESTIATYADFFMEPPANLNNSEPSDNDAEPSDDDSGDDDAVAAND
jgi:hypothetical protein